MWIMVSTRPNASFEMFDREIPAAGYSSRAKQRVASDQFDHRLAVLQQALWTAVVVGNCRGGIYSENVVERRQNVLRCVSAGRRVLAARTGRPHVLSHLQPAAGEKHAAGCRPVVAPAEFVD